jgi:hypothetical protein
MACMAKQQRDVVTQIWPLAQLFPPAAAAWQQSLAAWIKDLPIGCWPLDSSITAAAAAVEQPTV